MLWCSKLKQIFQAHYILYSLLLVALTSACAGSLWFAKQVRRGWEQEEDTECRNKPYRLALELERYKLSYGCLPPPFISDQFGKPLYSWRVLAMAIAMPDAGKGPWDEFDYTKPWDHPVNLQLTEGVDDWRLNSMFSCPSIRHEKTGQTDYFYVLNAEDRWPRDFFMDANSRPKIFLVESQWRDVYWSEPVDFVYDKSVQGFLDKLRETKPPHPGGYNCVTTDFFSFKIPYGTTHYDDLLISTLDPRPAKVRGGAEKEKIDQLVARLIRALGDPPKNVLREPLLLLGELGPQAAAAAPIIRRIRDEGDSKIQPVAAMALARIEK